MAKKQTRRSISVSRTTYERLKAFCEANNVSMSQLVETRVNDFLGGDGRDVPTRPVERSGTIPSDPPRPAITPNKTSAFADTRPVTTLPGRPTTLEERRPPPAPTPMTSVAARFAVEPPPPIIKPKQQESAPKPAEKRPDQIFTF